MKVLKFLLVIIMIFPQIASAHIVKVETFESMKAKVQTAEKHTLVLFDIDKVLIVPTEDFVFEDPIRAQHFYNLVKKYPGDTIGLIVSDYFKKRTVELLDRGLIGLFKTLESQKISVMALTQWQTGPYGSIEKMEEVRLKELEQVNISFAKTTPFSDHEKIIEHISTNGPMLKSGVMLTGSADKGSVLKGVLSHHAKHGFKKIVFVDDRLDNLQVVEKACFELNIDFSGLHYTLAEAHPYPQFNPQIEAIRFEILEKEGLWLTGKALEARLSENSKISRPKVANISR